MNLLINHLNFDENNFIFHKENQLRSKYLTFKLALDFEIKQYIF